jgi:hypothetical protein
MITAEPAEKSRAAERLEAIAAGEILVLWIVEPLPVAGAEHLDVILDGGLDPIR